MAAVGVVAGGVVTLTLAFLGTRLSPVIAAVVACGLLGVAAMLLWPEFAFLMLAVSIPFERLGRFTNDFDAVAISLSRIFGIIALGSLLLSVGLRRWKLRFPLPFWLYAGYVAIAAMGNLWAFSPTETFRDTFRVIGNLLYFFLVVNIVKTFRLAKLGVIVWLCASMASGLYTLKDYYSATRIAVEEKDMGLTSLRLTSVVMDDAESRVLGTKVLRAFGTTAHPTLHGLNMTMTLPFFFWLIRTEKRRLWKAFWLGGLLLCGYNVVLSNTRAVMLTAVLVLGLCALFRLWRLTAQAVILAVLLAALAVPFIPEDVFMRTLDPSMYTPEKSDSIRVRFKFWAKSYELIQQNWLTGIGIGDQTTIVKMVTDEVTGRVTPDGLKASAHNEFIWVLVEVGIVGYLFFWAFVFLVSWAPFRAASLYRSKPEHQDRYWFLVACQVLVIVIPLFGLQSEVFHYALKGWWTMVALSWVVLGLARTGDPEEVQAVQGVKAG